MIDLAYLRGLMNGNEQLVQKFLNIFKLQAPKQVAELGLQIENKDWEGVSNTAHSLKSQFEYLKLESLAEQIAHIELLADEKQTETISDFAGKIEVEFLELFKKEFTA